MTRLVDALFVVGVLWGLSYVLDIEFQQTHALAAWFASLVFIIAGSFNNLYRSWRSDSILVEISRIWLAWFIASASTCSVMFLVTTPTVFSVRLGLWWLVLAPLSISAMRVTLRQILRTSRRLGYNYRRTAIVGTTRLASQIAGSINSAPWMGLKLIGFYDDRHPNQERARSQRGITIKGTIDDLISHAEAGDVDQVYITLPLRAEQRIKDLISRLAEIPHLSILYAPDFFVFNMLHARWEQIGNLHVVNVVTTPFLGVSGVAKRIEDIVLGSIIVLLIALPMLAIALAIKLTSKGPVIFRQRRYGLNGREFEIWKFRTMTVCEDKDGFVQAKRGDKRVTPLGRFLRKTSLDELPQFLNVLRGDMSIVGPRPHPVALDEQHRHLIPHYVFRHKIRPGITGLAQVSGFRGETDTLDKMRNRIEKDIEYVERWSLLLDLEIIGLTLFRGFNDKNAV